MINHQSEAVYLPQAALGLSAGLYVRDNGDRMHRPVTATLGESEVSKFAARISTDVLEAALSSRWREECKKTAEILKLPAAELEAATVEALKSATDAFATSLRGAVLAKLAKPEQKIAPEPEPAVNRVLVQRYGFKKSDPTAREGK